MESNRKPPQTHPTGDTGKASSQVKARQSLRLDRKSHILTATWVVLASMATAANLGLVQIVESETQSLFFELRGAVAPPNNIVILAIDEQSLSVPEQYYRTNPQQYSDLKLLQAWPWHRGAYAQAIERLMGAGARSVALDVVFAGQSAYGAADDRALAQVLQRYAGRVTLAAQYEQLQLRQGSLIQLTQPQRLFWTKPMSLGFVNFPLEADGKIHKFASEFPKLLAQKNQAQFDNFDSLKVAIPSFERAVVTASFAGETRGDKRAGDAGDALYAEGEKPLITRPSPLATQSKGDHIYFYGPGGTFEQIPFWHVLDSDNWNTYLQQGKYFKDKIVIIGATAKSLQDFHNVPFSQSWFYPESIAGVEIQANAIATILQGREISEVIPHTSGRGLFVLLFVSGCTVFLTFSKRAITRFGFSISIAIAWGSISYVCFIHQHLILPTAVPMMAIAVCGSTYLVTGAIGDNLKKIHLRRTLERYASSPVVQEIISQQDDLQDLLQQRELLTVGKILSDRYKIVKVLSAGGFSETYVAEDCQRPGNPLCVVKQLKPASDRPQHLQVARRLFQLEAETLEKLGKHDSIPQLLAYFEQDEEFYLVQEYIVGHPLSWELKPGKPISESVAIAILQDLLQILAFVHSQNVIHRDIKPSNIMRRHSDYKLVLIDFGAVKQVSTQLPQSNGKTSLTVSIGTHGYAPSEQNAGHAFFSSDIYAVGMTVIKGLTGLAPHELQLDPDTGEILWIDKVQISLELAEILSKMVRYDFRQRYVSAIEVLIAVNNLLVSPTKSLVGGNLFSDSESTEDLDTATAVWISEPTEPDSTTNLMPASPLNSFE
ncbi:MAG TPA: serine/threonine-protein kinase [Leptolyngbyaceae cyanobacterium]